ncbi:MAG TPA: metalloprotease PmbA [Burkholderiales bacterium]|nr:metalloprotease PmbA [Burkholderiales bacterium]
MQKTSFAYSLDQFRTLVDDVLKQALKKGASACEADVSEGYGQSVTVRCGEVETIEYNHDKGVGITVYIGQKKGYASSSDLSPKALSDSVDAALSIARFTAADECAGLPDPALLARNVEDLDLFHPWEISVEEAADIARASEAAGFALDKRIVNSEGASVSCQQSQFIAGNSAGFMGGFLSSRHYVSCALIAAEGDAMQRDDWYSSERAPELLAKPEAIGKYAGERALSRLRSRKIATQGARILFEAPVANGLIGHFVGAASGGSLYRKSSFLLDALGKPVFSPIVNLREEPHLRGGQSSSYFDDDGVATHPRDVVKGGVLQGYFLGTYSARKLGMQSTGNAGGNHNLILAPGKRDFRAMLKALDTGLLVTELMGQGINMVTGDYSRGAVGYWVEKGVIQYPVEEITIAGNLRDMYRNIEAIGADELVRGSRRCPSILISNMTIAGS